VKITFVFFVFLVITNITCAQVHKITLKSASEASYPPFAVTTNEHQADGFSVDLLKAVAHTMGLGVKFYVDEWQHVKTDLQKGLIDVLPLVGRTPEREAYFDFTTPYLTMHGTVFVRKDNHSIRAMSDLSGKQLLVMKGDNAHEFLLAQHISEHIIATPSFEQAFQLLSAGQYDAVVVQKLVGIHLIRELKLDNIKPVSFIIQELQQNFCFAVKEGDKELLALLNEGLAIVKANGVYEQLYHQWFSFLGDDKSNYQRIVRILIFTGILLLILSSLFYLWQKILQNKINEKTRALRHSEQLLQNVLLGANLGFWDWYYQTNKHSVSERWLDILGLNRMDLEHTIIDWSERIHPDDLLAVEQSIEHAIEQDIPYRIEFRMQHADGSWVWIESSGRVIERDAASGQPLRLCGTHQDITRRVQAKLKQQEHHKHLQVLLENINAISWELDLHTQRFTYVSPNAERILGYPLDTWINMNSWVSMVIPSDRDAALEHCYAETVAGRDHNFEYRMHKKNGELIWVLDIVTVITDDTGKPVKLTGFIIDNTRQKLAEQTIRESANEQRAILSAIPDLMLVLDADGRYLRVWANDPQKLSGNEQSLLGRTVFDVLDDRSAKQIMSALKEADEKGFSSGQNICVNTASGYLWYELSTSLKNKETSPHQFIVLSRDITKRKDNEEQLRLAASVFTHAREGIMITDTDAHILEVNNAFSKITGYSRDEVLGKNPRLLKSGRQGADFYKNMWQKLTEKGFWSGEIWNQNKNSEIFSEQLTISSVYSDNNKQLYVALFTDITEQKYHQQQLENIAHFDALTNLPNRLLLTDRLNQALVQAQRRQLCVAIAFLDIDNFKEINDKYGHSIGDKLLSTLAGRMQYSLREGDTIARFGGDEFVVVLTDLADSDASLPWLSRLLDVSAQAIKIDHLSLNISTSIGVTFYPQTDDMAADQLLRQADQAMYQAKLEGKNCYHLFDADADRDVRGHHEGIKHIYQALENNEFVLYYQPKVNMRSGQVIGVEALIRWRHPDRGLLLPGHFLPSIENHAISIDLGNWVIAHALADVQRWHCSGLDIDLSINISALQLQQADFTEYFLSLLAHYPKIKADKIILEVLETSALEDMLHVSQIIQSCSEKGIKFALDDFGTGYSSLTYLKRLPVAQLKIDQTFVFDMLDDPENLAILEGVYGLGNAFHHQIIAEGVETIEHGEMLIHLGIELAQGYAIAHPLPAADVPQWIENWQPDPIWSNTRAINRGDIPLLFASTEHRAWIRAIEEWFNGERNVPPTMNQFQCRFGQWLHHQGKTRYGERSVFHVIEQLHEQVHAIAARLCQYKNQGKMDKARVELVELKTIRDKLIKCLKRLIR